MKDVFIAGVKEKYPKEVLEGRLTVEGNVIACCYIDPLLIDECDFKSTDFITIYMVANNFGVINIHN